MRQRGLMKDFFQKRAKYKDGKMISEDGGPPRPIPTAGLPGTVITVSFKRF